jgi:hypothetical protein
LVEEVKFLAGLEADGFAGSDADLGAGAGIAADAGFAGTDIEDTEAAQLDALALGEGLFEGLEDGIDSGFGLVALEAGALNHLVNDVLFYQGFLPSGEGFDPRLIVEMFGGVVNVRTLP